jgi:hypothetical protein
MKLATAVASSNCASSRPATWWSSQGIGVLRNRVVRR